MFCYVRMVKRFYCDCGGADCGNGLCYKKDPTKPVKRSYCDCGGADCGNGLCYTWRRASAIQQGNLNKVTSTRSLSQATR